jgi:hypothetical protein
MTENTIKLDDVSKIVSFAPFWAIRRKAIQSYAALEQSLCGVFAFIADLDRSTAGTIFFNIIGGHSLVRILERLVQSKYEDEYKLFWKSTLKGFRGISEERNQIVHWTAASTVSGIDSNGLPIVSLNLVPPNFWDRLSDRPPITIHTLDEFIRKCDIYERACNIFLLHVMGKIGSSPWDDIFHQPLVYPPLDTHPLSRNYKALSNSPLVPEG